MNKLIPKLNRYANVGADRSNRPSKNYKKITFLSPASFLLKPQVAFLGLLCLLVLSSAIGVVYTKHLSRSLYIKLQNLQRDRDSLHIEWTKLLLEQGTLASDVRVEKIAREQLAMKVPGVAQTVVIKP